MPDGPASVEEFARWPKTVVEKLFARGDGSDAERLNRLKSLLAGGLQVYSDYSGMAGEYEFLFQLAEALASSARVELNVTHRRFCDINKISQAVLKQISETEIAEQPCVMCDINSRLPKHAIDWLDAAMPSPEDTAESSANSYVSMEKYLMENRDAIFSLATMDWCVAHNRKCSLFPEPSAPDDEAQPLVANFAVVCEEKLEKPLSDTHLILSAILEPSLLGWPVRRKRMFSAGLNRAQVAWVGPDPENGDEILEDFLQFFQASMKVDGGIFLVCNDEDVRAEEKKMARARGHAFVSSDAKLERHQILAPGQLVRLEEYEQLYAAENLDAGASFFADLDQNLSGASTAGPMIPSLLTHGTMYALHSGRAVCPEELYFSHGYNVVPLPKGSSARSCRIKDFLKGLPAAHRLHLLGNGWHLPVVSSWVFYILSHCVRLNRRMTVQPERSLLRKGGSRLSEPDWEQTPEKKRKEDSQ
eukprot:s7_g69.t1